MLVLLSVTAGRASGPARLRLTDVPVGTAWIGWNQSGIYDLDLPPEWSFTTTSDHPTKALLADDRVIELPAGVRIQALGTVRLRVRASCLKGRFQRGRIDVEVPAARLNFAAGAQFVGRHELFGPEGRTTLLALYRPHAPALAVTYRNELRAGFDRVQWQSPDGAAAHVTELVLPELAIGEVPDIASFGLWSTAQLNLSCQREQVTIGTDQLGWVQLNGQTLRTGPPRLDAPRAEIRVRQATFRRRALVELPCRVLEPTGLLAEGLQLDTTGAPVVLAFDAGSSPAVLTDALDEFGAQRRRAAGWSSDLLTDSIRDYLIPLWCGLWYDADLGAETVLEPPSLEAFRVAWQQAEAATIEQAVEWLERQEPGVLAQSAAEPEALGATLSAMVNALTGDDAKAGVWWSVWLSDQLSAAGQGPVGYWYAASAASIAVPSPGELTLHRLHDRLAKRQPGELLGVLAAYQRQHPVVPSIDFARLAPEATQPVTLVADAGRRTPVGHYAGAVRLQAEGAEPVSVPLAVTVLPSLGSQALVSLVWLLPLSLALGVVLATARRSGRERRELLRLQAAAQRRFTAWHEYLERYGEAPEESPEQRDEAARAFAALGLLEFLSRDLFGEYTRVREAGGVGLEAFLRSVRQHLKRLAENGGDA